MECSSAWFYGSLNKNGTSGGARFRFGWSEKAAYRPPPETPPAIPELEYPPVTVSGFSGFMLSTSFSTGTVAGCGGAGAFPVGLDIETLEFGGRNLSG